MQIVRLQVKEHIFNNLLYIRRFCQNLHTDHADQTKKNRLHSRYTDPATCALLACSPMLTLLEIASMGMMQNNKAEHMNHIFNHDPVNVEKHLGYVNGLGNGEGLAIVQGLNDRQLLQMLLSQGWGFQTAGIGYFPRSMYGHLFKFFLDTSTRALLSKMLKKGCLQPIACSKNIYGGADLVRFQKKPTSIRLASLKRMAPLSRPLMRSHCPLSNACPQKLYCVM